MIGIGIGADSISGLIEMLKKDTECIELEINGKGNVLTLRSFCLTKPLQKTLWKFKEQSY